ncbi:MAG: hypothetical protein AB8G11_07790 [Saprospiraceae bacterium]
MDKKHNREYVKIPKSSILPDSSNKKRTLDDKFWINLIHIHLLTFYKNHDEEELKKLIIEEDKKSRSDIEDLIKDYMMEWFKTNNKRMFRQGIIVNTEPKVKYEQKGFYDLKFEHSDWVNSKTSSLNYYVLECKNLENSASLVAKYVFYKRTPKENDGGVYRYFNGKYAQSQNFGGMIGFVLKGDIQKIKTKICKKLETEFDTSPNGDLIKINHSSIESNDFTFDSIHSRKDGNFTIHHLLFDFNIE